MSDQAQLELLTPEGQAPDRWPCPTCNGTRTSPNTGGPCRVCEQQGTVAWDPHDPTIPY